MSLLSATFDRLVERSKRRTEAEIQADVRQFILSAPFQLDEEDLEEVKLESPLGDRRRIDVEVGATVIEVKRDLNPKKVKRDAIDQLKGYVVERAKQSELRYVGVLTDGQNWECYHIDADELRLVTSIQLVAGQVDELVVWLEGVLATTRGIVPTADSIASKLGASSSAFMLDRATLQAIYQAHKDNPSVEMKRTLWARLLTSALGTHFEDTDELFIEHTLLVNSAEIIAHAVLGLQPETISPSALLAGELFDQSGIYGVVEHDFFDWITEIEDGRAFVRTLSRRLSRFDWTAVEQDVLKVLYESVIGTETRKRLGEYYTPDWLARVIVESTIDDPVNQRVLDPACGSGTFLFHAIRRYIEKAEEAGLSVSEILKGATDHIIGMDLHPVAVTLARVTYLLALGRDRLVSPERETIQVPVYLGDSLQWREQSRDLFSAGNLTIQTDDNASLFASELRFPDELLKDASRFDELVSEMASRASNRKPDSKIPSLKAVFKRLAMPDEFQEVVQSTFVTMCELHDQGRDHIWGYYIRNLARPMWLARSKNAVDIIIGNPPWLAYRNMTPEMQSVFKKMSEDRSLWAGAELATHQDLSGLFLVRASELYLKREGKFALVLPNTVLDREHYAGLRSGTYGDPNIGQKLAFECSWDLRRLRPHFFPRASCVIFGSKVGRSPRKMTTDTEQWTGKIPSQNASWSETSEHISRVAAKIKRLNNANTSHYSSAFTQGAVFSPHLVFVVKKQAASTLGMPAGRSSISSSRSVHEKKPWKQLPDLTGVVETQFIRPALNGENLFPFRIHKNLNVVLPCDSKGILDQHRIELSPGYSNWWNTSQEIWETHRSSDRLSLRDQIDYQSKLTKQFPIQPLRLVYNRSGMHLVAAIVEDRRVVIANGLYWAPMNTKEEAKFLSAILNAQITTELTRPFMSYGKDERDIHKHVWQLPIPKFDPNNLTHVRLTELANSLEKLANAFDIKDDLHFAATRRHIRELLSDTAEGQELEELVYELIS